MEKLLTQACLCTKCDIYSLDLPSHFFHLFPFSLFEPLVLIKASLSSVSLVVCPVSALHTLSTGLRPARMMMESRRMQECGGRW